MKRRFFFDPWHYDAFDALLLAVLLAMLATAASFSVQVAFQLLVILGAAFILGQKRIMVRMHAAKEKEKESE